MRYEFRVAGDVSEPVGGAFPELDRARVPDQTLFFGTVTDEAHLYQVLMRFQSLGLHVLEMRQLPQETRQEES
ncbi:hypothetical protein [Yinghuangia seranimata]|uniref:hypothetical protein n=1 Tax=Yinghuangia seranimata TaxID=408067 RepID=UPI00248C158A|nr:hypothetical protein [Yinghuangia seranimata]MDI2124994.1 hypothetical protein [Yinghuangia seranimata]